MTSHTVSINQSIVSTLNLIILLKNVFYECNVTRTDAAETCSLWVKSVKLETTVTSAAFQWEEIKSSLSFIKKDHFICYNSL